MRVFKALKKQVSRSILVLKKHYSVPADIYFPVSFNNPQHGYQDENVNYDDGRAARVLIPAIFRKQNQTLELLDSFYNPGDIAMFEPNDVLWPKFAKIVCRYDGAVRNFIINDIEEIKDDEVSDPDNIIFRKYVLIPSMSIDVERNRDELIDSLNREVDYPTDEQKPADESITTHTPPSDTTTQFIFEPVK